MLIYCVVPRPYHKYGCEQNINASKLQKKWGYDLLVGNEDRKSAMKVT
jgi:hypothetical protein